MVNQRTLEAYKAEGVEYSLKGYDEHLKLEREKTSLDPNPTKVINAMYRFRNIDADEVILYSQFVTAIANVTKNKITWNEDVNETSTYRVPTVERANRFDSETEKQSSEIRQVQSVKTHYLIPFNTEEAMKLKPYCNLGTKYYVQQEDGIVRSVPNFEQWLTRPFEELIAGIKPDSEAPIKQRMSK